MMSNNDAYGHLIWNAFKGLTSFDIVERDDGYVNVSGYERIYLSDYAQWDRSEKEAIKFAKGRCLDMGCGAGRVPLYLQGKGLQCLGIDTSPLAIKVCKLRGVKHAKIMGIEDLSTFKRGSFTSLIMLGNNFGLLGSRKKAKRLLKMMHRITSDDAVIIAEDRDPYITDNPVHFKYHQMNRKRGRMPGQLKIRVRFMQYTSDWFDYLLVSKEEMKDLLSGTGWKVKRFIDSENHKQDGRYIAIITK